MTLPAQAVDAPSSWVATWGAAMMPTDVNGAPDFTGQTLREIVHSSAGGSQARVWLSNRFGRQPLHIGAAHIALNASGSASQPNSGSAIVAGTDRVLTFHHHRSVIIPPGAMIVSDPAALAVSAFSNLAISIYFPDATPATTEHFLSSQTSYGAAGDQTGAPTLEGRSWPVNSWYFLSGVDVATPAASSIVAFGDSITDGSRSKFNTNHRWPDFLAARLAADPGTRAAGVLGVVDVGIAGNRVLGDGVGPSALSRIDFDVLARSHARYLIVLEGINDIARISDHHQPYGDLAERIEQGYAQIAAQAHQHGLLVFGATLTPYGNCTCATPEGRAVRHRINQWIRTTRVYDGVIDFARVTRDPAHPEQYRPQYDSDDHVHPSEAGYRAMANAIDLTLFTAPPAAAIASAR